MAFCTKCGTQLADDANFCGKCGTATGATAQGNVATDKTEITMVCPVCGRQGKGKLCIMDGTKLVPAEGQSAPVQESSGKMVSVEDILKELNELVGFKSVKDAIAKIANTLNMLKLTGQATNRSWHFLFMGKPSAEKIKVAHMLADLLKDAGVLPTNNVIETDRSKLVGAYLGQTGMQVSKLCDSAMGGILFIDDANALKQGPSDTFGQEAVDTLLKRMEDDRGKFVVLASGPTDEMNQFLQSNSGFKSRFTDCLNFDE
jgi:AAA+ superfamily predicted ATPase